MNGDDGPRLVRVDASGNGEAETVALDTVFAALAIAADGDGNLWVARKGGMDHVSTTGALVRSVEAPFEDRLELGSLQATFAGPPSFGSLWAYDPAGPVVLRLDPADGTVIATIEIPGCPAIEYHSNYPGHDPLIYALRGVDGMRDAVVAPCPMDVNHQYPGPMNVIDPMTNSVVAQLDLGPAYGRGVVLDGRWWVPVGPALDSEGTWGLARIDPDSGMRASIVESPVESAWRPDAVVTGNALWALVFDVCASEEPCRSVVHAAASDLAPAP
jgi:hypothetical protein